MKFLTISNLHNLRLLSQRFRDIAFLSGEVFDELKENRDNLKDIIDVEKQREQFDSLFDSFFTERFNKRFSLPLRYYMRYHLDFLKRLIEPSNIFFHMFNCPRSYLSVNVCSQCSFLFVDWQTSELDLVYSIRRCYLDCYLKNGFSKKVRKLFEDCKIKCSKLEVVYKSRQQYENIMNDRERCLNFLVITSPAGLIDLYLEVLLRVLFNSIYTFSAELDNDEQREYFLQEFLVFVQYFIKDSLPLFFAKGFIKTFTIYILDVHYRLFYLRIVNDHYIRYCNSIV